MTIERWIAECSGVHIATVKYNARKIVKDLGLDLNVEHRKIKV